LGCAPTYSPDVASRQHPFKSNSVLITSFSTPVILLADGLTKVFKRYPLRITAAVAGITLFGAGGAFALANLAPDASQLPVHQVLETVRTPATELADSPAIAPLTLYRSDITRPTDTADTLLARLGVDDSQAATFMRHDALVLRTLLGRSGRNVSAETRTDQGLQRLIGRWSTDDSGQFFRLVVERNGNTFSSRLENAALRASTQLASGTIQSSLFAATDDAKIPDSVAVQLAEIFSGDIDFHRALRKGDRFSVVYETLQGDGEPLRSGRVLSAEFVNNGKTHQAMWFQEPLAAGVSPAQMAQSKGAYYTMDGQSLRRAFLASPLAFSRITSGFKMRLHPILQTMRAHLGIDYGAPTGTPVRTVGNGIVEFAGVQNGFGNVIFIRHNNQNVTVYGHLSRIDVRKGQSVEQGQKIGAVGATGWATGPHLHFEFRVNGQHKDPSTLARQGESTPVTAAAKPQFDELARLNRIALAAASMEGASAQ
jgi:murein DD-endopeptidase MepM/ murein hydrolase activator NlpD